MFTQEVEARTDLSYPNFAQLYRTLMFDAQKSVSVDLVLLTNKISEEVLKSFIYRKKSNHNGRILHCKLFFQTLRGTSTDFDAVPVRVHILNP